MQTEVCTKSICIASTIEATKTLLLQRFWRCAGIECVILSLVFLQKGSSAIYIFSDEFRLIFRCEKLHVIVGFCFVFPSIRTLKNVNNRYFSSPTTKEFRFNFENFRKFQWQNGRKKCG